MWFFPVNLVSRREEIERTAKRKKKQGLHGKTNFPHVLTTINAQPPTIGVTWSLITTGK
jgi:hypothetical protein